MVVQLEKREALAKEVKIMERKKAQKTSKRLRQAATTREKQSRNQRSSSSGEYFVLQKSALPMNFFKSLQKARIIKFFQIRAFRKMARAELC